MAQFSRQAVGELAGARRYRGGDAAPDRMVDEIPEGAGVEASAAEGDVLRAGAGKAQVISLCMHWCMHSLLYVYVYLYMY